MSFICCETKIGPEACVAMTGELNLSGEVLMVSGIEAKLSYAESLGTKVVVVPKDNYEEAVKLVAAKRWTIRVLGVGHIREVIDAVLLKSVAQGKKELQQQSSELKHHHDRCGNVVHLTASHAAGIPNTLATHKAWPSHKDIHLAVAHACSLDGAKGLISRVECGAIPGMLSLSVREPCQSY